VRRFLWACGVSYASLVVTHFGVAAEAREALQDAAADKLPEPFATKAQELLECPYCMSFWLALIVARGRPIKALQLAGLASIPTSLVLIATD
jgi:hypothetical protein